MPAMSSVAGRRDVAPGRVVVLGGTGFLGSAVTRAFLDAGSAVTVLDRVAPSVPRADLVAGAEILLGEADDPVVLTNLLGEADHVVHAVGGPVAEESNRNPVDTLFATLPGIITLLEALRARAGVGLSFLSSGGVVYGRTDGRPVAEDAPCDPITTYGVTKLAAEKYIGVYASLFGVSSRVLRVGNAYGPTQPTGSGQGVVAAFAEAARAGRPVPVFGDGEVVRDFVHVGDVAAAVVGLAARSGGPLVVNVGSGVGHSVRQVARAVERVSGRRLVLEHRPGRDFDVRHLVLDTGRLSALLEWRPRTFEDGLAGIWERLVEAEPIRRADGPE